MTCKLLEGYLALEKILEEKIKIFLWISLFASISFTLFLPLV
jgi:hypothetical protein